MANAGDDATIGDAEFESLALPLLPYVARVARAIAPSETDADDLVQETFLRAYRYWHTFQKGTDCKRWLTQICRNLMVDSTRRDQRETAYPNHELESRAAVEVHERAQAGGVADMYARMDLGPAILKAIAGLEPIFRDVVVLSDIEDLSYEDVAVRLGVPVGTVRSRLYRARRQLQDQLVEYAVDAGYTLPHKP
jgi:RNA polymerase sigma-70 factor (ECF subfamily)